MTALMDDRPEGFRRVAAALAAFGHPHVPQWLDVPARTCAEAAAALSLAGGAVKPATLIAAGAAPAAAQTILDTHQGHLGPALAAVKTN